MGTVLSKAVIEASDAARDAFLRKIDPNAFAAPPKPPPESADLSGGPPPPPPPMGKKILVLNDAFYKEGLFSRCAEAIRKQESVLETRTTTDNLDYAGWFNYFFAEAKPFVSGNELGRIFCVLFDLDDAVEQSGRELRVKTTFRYPAALSPAFSRLLIFEPGGVPLGVLTYLFEEGFQDFAEVDAKLGKVATNGAAPTDKIIEHSFGKYFDLSTAATSQQITPETDPHHLFFYRGDTREPQTVLLHGGAKCRMDLEHWRKAAHVNEPWHPWKDAAASGKMWVRKGNRDNDYFTVNSVAMDFHISCAYPMLRLGEIDKTLNGHIVGWSDDERARLRRTGKADFCRVKNRRLNAVEFVLCDRSRVYLCAFQDDTKLSPTYKAPNDYPEMGVRNVGLEQIVAWFEILRYHNNDTLRGRSRTGPGAAACYESTLLDSTMTIKVTNWGWMNGAKSGKNALGLADPDALALRLQSYVGTVFEIGHSRLVSRTDTTFDPSVSEPAPNVWAKVSGVHLVR